MKLQLALAFAAAAFAVFADDAPDATSNPIKYSLDTCSQPRVLRTQAEVAMLWEATYKAGETVTRTAPDGTSSTLVGNAATGGSVALGVNAGGLWTFTNSAEGEATFAVRHSAYGTLGDGTVASPAKIVDVMELFEMATAGTVGDGYVYTFVGVPGASPLPPIGLIAEAAGDGLWKLVADPDVVVSGSRVYLLDTRQGGPDRTVNVRRGYSIAYSGDDWARDASAASTVTVKTPTGAETSQSFTGTDATPFVATKRGEYTVTMTAGGKTMTAVITYAPGVGLIVFVK